MCSVLMLNYFDMGEAMTVTWMQKMYRFYGLDQQLNVPSYPYI